MRLLLPADAPLWLTGFANSIENKFRDLLSAPLRLMGLATAELPAPGDFSQGLVYDLTTGQIAYSTGLAWRQIFGSGNAALGAIAALTPAADRYVYFTGPAAAALGTISAFGRSLLDDADAAAARATIGVGAVGTQGDGDKGDIIVSASGAAWTVDADAISYAKLQNVSATDRVLGRASAGAGDVEEIAFTAAARTLAAQSTQAAMRTTGLGLGTAATVDTGISGTKVALTDGANSWSAAQTFINSGGIRIQDVNGSHTLGLASGSDLTANRILTIVTGDASRTLDFTATTGTGNWAFSISPTFTGTAGFAAISATGNVDSAGRFASNNGTSAISFQASGSEGWVNATNAALSAFDVLALRASTISLRPAAAEVMSVSTGAVTVTGTLTASEMPTFNSAANGAMMVVANSNATGGTAGIKIRATGVSQKHWALVNGYDAANELALRVSNAAGGDPYTAGASIARFSPAGMTMTGSLDVSGDLTWGGAAWAAWTPTWTNLTVGNGTVTARYVRIGKLVFARLAIIFGSTTSVSGLFSFSFPVAKATYAGIIQTPLATVRFFDSSTAAVVNGELSYVAGSAAPVYYGVSGGVVGPVGTSATQPFTWATGDEVVTQFFYEAA